VEKKRISKRISKPRDPDTKFISEIEPGRRFPKKHILNLYRVPIYFEKYANTVLIFILNSVLYGLFVLPFRFIQGFAKFIL
jgi:hypothetical protein